jgi:transcriptional regulator with XRE-family HTH domain
VTNGDLQALGEMLREAREAQAFSLQEVEAQTRIRAKFLQAFEQGDISELPSIAHAKGFLRNYAQFLHLDVDDVIARFAQATGSGAGTLTQPTAIYPREQVAPPIRPIEEPAAVTDESEDEEEAQVPPPQPPPIAAARGGQSRSRYIPPGQRVGPGAPLTMGRQAAQPQRAPTDFTQPVAQPVPQTAPAPDERRRGSGSLPQRIIHSPLFTAVVLLAGFGLIMLWITSTLSKISGSELVPAEQQSEFLNQFATSETTVPTPTFAPTSTPQADAGLQILDRVVLSLDVKQRTWVKITVDGTVQFEGQAQVGDVLHYEGSSQIALRTGNGAALDATYNGQDLGLLGDRGQVVERIFTTSGQITPTYTPTVVPTNTSVPTPTPSRTPAP